MKVLATGLADITVAFLRNNGFAVDEQGVDVIDNAEALEAWLQDGLYGAGIINLDNSGNPDNDGFDISVARGLRTKKIATPLVGISRGSQVHAWGEYRALFLENGGDDLLPDPVNPRELAASLRAIRRRQSDLLLDVLEYQSGGAKLRVNLTTQAVSVNDVPIRLTKKLIELLVFLASHPNRILSREMALNELYIEGVDDEPQIKVIEVFICALRRKFTKVHPDGHRLIETVWGRGYRISEQSEMSQAA